MLGLIAIAQVVAQSQHPRDVLSTDQVAQLWSYPHLVLFHPPVSVTRVTSCGLDCDVFRYYAVEFELLEVSGKTVMGTSYLQVVGGEGRDVGCFDRGMEQAFILSGLLRPFLIETAIILIHPLPFVNYIVHIWGLDTYCAYSSDGEEPRARAAGL